MERGRGKARFVEICRATAWVCVVACIICVLIRDRFERDADTVRADTEGLRAELLARADLESKYVRLVEDMARVSTRNPRMRTFMEQAGFQGLPPPATGAPAP